VKARQGGRQQRELGQLRKKGRESSERREWEGEREREREREKKAHIGSERMMQ
jgi:hypothetical protein